MAWLEDREMVDRLLESHSPYAIVNAIAQEARRRSESVQPCILSSAAITWVMSGIRPPEADRRQAKQIRNKKVQLDDELYQIDDFDIRDAVRQSFYATQKANHLEFKYEKVLEPASQARVRVLTRIIYNQLKEN